MKNLNQEVIKWIIAIGMSMGLLGCKGDKEASQSNKTVISNSGSSTMVNLAQTWAEEYHKAAPNVIVEVGGSGSGVGIYDLTQGRVDIANASRDMTDSEKEQAKRNTGKTPVEWTVGYDAMAIYVHKDNPVEELTIEQLAQIYGEGGTIDRWPQLGVSIRGPDEIVRVSRHNTSGTYVFFREHILDKKDFKHGSKDMSGCKDVVGLVGRTPGAIGYSGMGFKTDEVKFVKVKKSAADRGYLPTLENVVAGNYSLGRSLHMYTLGQPAGHVKEYIDWILSPAGQEIVKKEGYVPVSAVK
ncbi:MAG: phosphate ABC transporter substrate-binding protein [Sedimentisphaerales bacterium]|nr:phosphate ABC transporter substrate-binding protein [Sedimentisphaerales bacterium]